MLQSIIVYSLMGFSLFGLGQVAAKREQIYIAKNKNLPFFTWEILFSLLIFAFFSGIRWNVGVDHLSYLSYYNELLNKRQFLSREMEPGFLFISKIFASLNIHFTFYFAFWAFLQLFFIYYAFKDERYLIPYLGIIIIFGGQYLDWMNGMRQALAATIFVFSTQYIYNRSFPKYLIAIFLASLFHKSAIILLIFYFIPNKDYFKNRLWTLSALLICILIGLNPYWFSVTDYLKNILSFLGYENLNIEYAIEVYRRTMAFGPRRILTLLLNILIIWHSPEMKNYYKNTRFLLFYNLTIIGILYYSLFANVGNLFLRPTYYFTIFQAISIAYLLHYLKTRSIDGVSFKYLVVLFLSISYLFFSLVAEHGKGDLDFVTYRFYWDYYN